MIDNKFTLCVLLGGIQIGFMLACIVFLWAGLLAGPGIR